MLSMLEVSRQGRSGQSPGKHPILSPRKNSQHLPVPRSRKFDAMCTSICLNTAINRTCAKSRAGRLFWTLILPSQRSYYSTNASSLIYSCKYFVAGIQGDCQVRSIFLQLNPQLPLNRGILEKYLEGRNNNGSKSHWVVSMTANRLLVTISWSGAMLRLLQTAKALRESVSKSLRVHHSDRIMILYLCIRGGIPLVHPPFFMEYYRYGYLQDDTINTVRLLPVSCCGRRFLRQYY